MNTEPTESTDELPLEIRNAGARFLSDPDTKATTLHVLAMLALGEDLYNPEDPTEPLEVFVALETVFRAKIVEENENRLQAMLLAVGTNEFYENPTAFVAVSEALLTGDIEGAMTGDSENLTSLEVLWAIYEIAANRDDDPDLSPEVLRLLIEIQDRFSQDPENEEGVFDPTTQQIVFVKTLRDQLAAELQQLGATPEMLDEYFPDPAQMFASIPQTVA